MMTSIAPIVELIVIPHCMCDRDVAQVRDLCAKFSIEPIIYDTWTIGDDVRHLPGHIRNLIEGRRSGSLPGTVYSDAFVNGKRLPLIDAARNMGNLETLIRESC